MNILSIDFSYFQNDNDNEEVNFNSKEYDKLLKIILAQSHDIPILVTKEHREIVNYVTDICMNQLNDDEEVYIYNIDSYHDMDRKMNTYDNNNWGRYIHKEIQTDVHLYWFPRIMKLNSLIGEIFDAVFICKNEERLSLSFDLQFKEFVDMCDIHSVNIAIEPHATDIR